PEQLAKEITEALDIPTIGIGAGRYCNGQVLVINDMLGLNKGFNPKFLKRYADLYTTSQQAIQTYCKEVKEHAFPAESNVFK
ncbi:MAG TPA: 3-methyl-2-oxobutanoate hydroxymethyltransferase, partial [Spirochaetota bacterium]|nr:3-methyl-2-oxobutanoate hydroxymethyltransferase [Spirochaetota bacterium]HPP51152.1 3-methyl-2-oxobutanoate hydroxymethyltransferase [Spirochaetota bacterium]